MQLIIETYGILDGIISGEVAMPVLDIVEDHYRIIERPIRLVLLAAKGCIIKVVFPGDGTQFGNDLTQGFEFRHNFYR